MAKKPTDTTALDAPAEGGSYVIENGVRTRVEEATKDHPDGNMNRNANGVAVGFDGRPSNPTSADGGKE